MSNVVPSPPPEVARGSNSNNAESSVTSHVHSCSNSSGHNSSPPLVTLTSSERLLRNIEETSDLLRTFRQLKERGASREELAALHARVRSLKEAQTRFAATQQFRASDPHGFLTPQPEKMTKKAETTSQAPPSARAVSSSSSGVPVRASSAAMTGGKGAMMQYVDPVSAFGSSSSSNNNAFNTPSARAAAGTSAGVAQTALQEHRSHRHHGQHHPHDAFVLQDQSPQQGLHVDPTMRGVRPSSSPAQTHSHADLRPTHHRTEHYPVASIAAPTAGASMTTPAHVGGHTPVSTGASVPFATAISHATATAAVPSSPIPPPLHSIVFAIVLAESHTRREIAHKWERRLLRYWANFKETRVAIALRPALTPPAVVEGASSLAVAPALTEAAVPRRSIEPAGRDATRERSHATPLVLQEQKAAPAASLGEFQDLNSPPQPSASSPAVPAVAAAPSSAPLPVPVIPQPVPAVPPASAASASGTRTRASLPIPPVVSLPLLTESTSTKMATTSTTTAATDAVSSELTDNAADQDADHLAALRTEAEAQRVAIEQKEQAAAAAVRRAVEEQERAAAREVARARAEREAAEEAAAVEAARIKEAGEAARLKAEQEAAKEAARVTAAEEAARRQAEQEAAEEAARLKAEQEAAEEAARLKAEQEAAEEAARLKAEQEAAEEAARIAAAEEAARRQAEQEAAEEAARIAAAEEEEAARAKAAQTAAEARRSLEDAEADARQPIEAEEEAARSTIAQDLDDSHASAAAAEAFRRLKEQRKAEERAARFARDNVYRTEEATRYDVVEMEENAFTQLVRDAQVHRQMATKAAEERAAREEAEAEAAAVAAARAAAAAEVEKRRAEETRAAAAAAAAAAERRVRNERDQHIAVLVSMSDALLREWVGNAAEQIAHKIEEREEAARVAAEEEAARAKAAQDAAEARRNLEDAESDARQPIEAEEEAARNKIAQDLDDSHTSAAAAEAARVAAEEEEETARAKAAQDAAEEEARLQREREAESVAAQHAKDTLVQAAESISATLLADFLGEAAQVHVAAKLKEEADAEAERRAAAAAAEAENELKKATALAAAEQAKQRQREEEEEAAARQETARAEAEAAEAAVAAERAAEAEEAHQQEKLRHEAETAAAVAREEAARRDRLEEEAAVEKTAHSATLLHAADALLSQWIGECAKRLFEEKDAAVRAAQMQEAFAAACRHAEEAERAARLALQDDEALERDDAETLEQQDADDVYEASLAKQAAQAQEQLRQEEEEAQQKHAEREGEVAAAAAAAAVPVAESSPASSPSDTTPVTKAGVEATDGGDDSDARSSAINTPTPSSSDAASHTSSFHSATALESQLPSPAVLITFADALLADVLRDVAEEVVHHHQHASTTTTAEADGASKENESDAGTPLVEDTVASSSPSSSGLKGGEVKPLRDDVLRRAQVKETKAMADKFSSTEDNNSNNSNSKDGDEDAMEAASTPASSTSPSFASPASTPGSMPPRAGQPLPLSPPAAVAAAAEIIRSNSFSQHDRDGVRSDHHNSSNNNNNNSIERARSVSAADSSAAATPHEVEKVLSGALEGAPSEPSYGIVISSPSEPPLPSASSTRPAAAGGSGGAGNVSETGRSDAMDHLSPTPRPPTTSSANSGGSNHNNNNPQQQQQQQPQQRNFLQPDAPQVVPTVGTSFSSLARSLSMTSFVNEDEEESPSSAGQGVRQPLNLTPPSHRILSPLLATPTKKDNSGAGDRGGGGGGGGEEGRAGEFSTPSSAPQAVNGELGGPAESGLFPDSSRVTVAAPLLDAAAEGKGDFTPPELVITPYTPANASTQRDISAERSLSRRGSNGDGGGAAADGAMSSSAIAEDWKALDLDAPHASGADSDDKKNSNAATSTAGAGTKSEKGVEPSTPSATPPSSPACSVAALESLSVHVLTTLIHDAVRLLPCHRLSPSLSPERMECVRPLSPAHAHLPLTDIKDHISSPHNNNSKSGGANAASATNTANASSSASTSSGSSTNSGGSKSGHLSSGEDGGERHTEKKHSISELGPGFTRADAQETLPLSPSLSPSPVPLVGAPAVAPGVNTNRGTDTDSSGSGGSRNSGSGGDPRTDLASLTTLVTAVATPNDFVEQLRQQEAAKKATAHAQNRYLTTRELAQVSADYLTSPAAAAQVEGVGPAEALTARAIALVLSVGLVHRVTAANRRAKRRVEAQAAATAAAASVEGNQKSSSPAASLGGKGNTAKSTAAGNRGTSASSASTDVQGGETAAAAATGREGKKGETEVEEEHAFGGIESPSDNPAGDFPTGLDEADSRSATAAGEEDTRNTEKEEGNNDSDDDEAPPPSSPSLGRRHFGGMGTAFSASAAGAGGAAGYSEGGGDDSRTDEGFPRTDGGFPTHTPQAGEGAAAEADEAEVDDPYNFNSVPPSVMSPSANFPSFARAGADGGFPTPSAATTAAAAAMGTDGESAARSSTSTPPPAASPDGAARPSDGSASTAAVASTAVGGGEKEKKEEAAAEAPKDKLPPDWDAGLRGVAERLARDFMDYAARRVLLGQGEGQSNQDHLRTPDCVLRDALRAINVQQLFTQELRARDVARLTGYYVDLAMNGTRERADPHYAPAALGEHNLFGRRSSGDVDGVLLNGPGSPSFFPSSPPGRDREGGLSSPSAVFGQDSARSPGSLNAASPPSVFSPSTFSPRLHPRNDTFLTAATAIHVRRAGLTQLVLEQCISNVMNDLVGDTVGWLGAVLAPPAATSADTSRH